MKVYNLSVALTTLAFLMACASVMLIKSFTTFTVAMLSILFLFLLLYSIFSKGIATRIFFIVLCVSHIIGLWTLHLFQNSFTNSGGAAVKQFDFSAEQFIIIFLPVLAMYFLVIILLNFLDVFLPPLSKISPLNSNNHLPLEANNKTIKFNLAIVFIILFMLPVHDFMFSNMVAVTGQSHLQNPLPFKIGGILFYFTKILLPIILLSLYFRARSSLILLIIVLGYALFVGLTQMSRSSLFMLVLPILLIHQYRRDYLYTALSGIFLVSGGILLGFFREIATEINILEIIKGQSIIDLFYLILPELSNFSFQYETLVNIASRFGGGQDVVLASQYSIDATGGLLANLSRIFLGDLTYASESSWHLYDFVPLQGQGVGYGGITAQLIQVSKGNYLLTLLIIIFLSIILKIFDYLIIKISNRSKNISVTYILVMPVILLFFLYSSFVLIYYYIVFLVCIYNLLKVNLNIKVKE